MSDLIVRPTPFGTVHVTGTGEDAKAITRRIAAQAGRRKFGKRVTHRTHTIGDTVTVLAIYRRNR